MNSTTKQRYISTSIWSDTWFDSLSGTEKLIYFYLLTNVHTNPAGIYPFALKYICADTGFSRDEVNAAMKKFQDAGKAFFYREYMIIPKWLKHQKVNERTTMFLGALKVLRSLPDEIKDFIRDRRHYDFDVSKYIGDTSAIDSLPIAYTEKSDSLSQNNGETMPNSTHDLDLDLDSDLDFDFDNNIRIVETPDSLSKHFIRRWQENADIFNCLARLKLPKDWNAFWEQNTMSLQQIDTAINHFIEAVRNGAIERRFIPSSPDGFVLNGWLARSQNPFKTQQGKRIAADNTSEDEVNKYFRRM